MDGYLAKPLDPKIFLQVVEGTAMPGGTSETEPSTLKSEQTVDNSTLLARFGGDRKLVFKLVNAFRKDCPRMIARIGSAIRARDAAALADAAHALAREVEKLAREGKLDGARELSGALEGRIAAFLLALQAIAQRGKNIKQRIRSRNSRRRKK